MDLPCASRYVRVVFYVNFPFYLIKTIHMFFTPGGKLYHLERYCTLM